MKKKIIIIVSIIIVLVLIILGIIDNFEPFHFTGKMFFGKKKRAEFMTEMSKDENKNMMICLLTLLIGLIPCGDGWQFKICLCPIAYGILFVPLILVIYFGVNGPGILIIISSVGFIFYLIALLGIFGKLMCGCLTHPCNWFFVMVVSLLFSIIVVFTSPVEIST